VDAPRIIADPNILMGKPVIAGTRISVELILDKLGAGETVEDLLLDYPFLTREGVLAALRFAARVVGNEVAYPFPGHAA
jgi:uncharacterized protein (DUF433 family)